MNTLTAVLNACSKFFVILLMAMGLTVGLSGCAGDEEGDMEETEQTEEAEGQMEGEDTDAEEEDGDSEEEDDS